MVSYDIIRIADYLSVMVNGRLDVQGFIEITDKVYEACVADGIRKLVIDVTGTAGTFSDSDKIEFAKYAAEKLKGKIDRYAYVYPHELLNYSSQLVAKGRGLNVRAYYSLEEALKWMEQ